MGIGTDLKVADLIAADLFGQYYMIDKAQLPCQGQQVCGCFRFAGNKTLLQRLDLLTKTPFLVFCTMVDSMVIVNLGLCVFNLIPIPPLDGSKILYSVLPYQVIYKIIPYEKYIQFVMIFLLWLGVLSKPIQLAVQFFYTLFMNLAQGVLF